MYQTKQGRKFYDIIDEIRPSVSLVSHCFSLKSQSIPHKWKVTILKQVKNSSLHFFTC